MDMCHFGLVGSGNPNPSNCRATHMAAATLRPSLTPLVVDLNEYCTWNAPPWFTWCSIQVVRAQGTDTMGLHAHLRDWAPGAYSFVYDVVDELGASKGRQNHPCFYDASGCL